VHKRFLRWAKKGIWQMVFNTLACDADTEWLMPAPPMAGSAIPRLFVRISILQGQKNGSVLSLVHGVN
jgi:hypothetical protein